MFTVKKIKSNNVIKSNRKIKTTLFLKIIFSTIFTVSILACSNINQINILKDFSIKGKPNIILITIDTLRADHLSCYNYERKTSPAIDSLAEDGILFTDAIVPLPKTTPSLFSILSGLYPKTHKVFTLGRKLSDEIILMPEVLKKHNYITGGVVGQFNCNRKFGFNQGFDFYLDDFRCIREEKNEKIKKIFGKFNPVVERRAEFVEAKSIEWLKSVIDRPHPFFIWLHFMDPHAAYDPPGKYATLYSGSTKMSSNSYHGKIIRGKFICPQAYNNGMFDYDYYLNRYDGEITYMDSHIKQLFEFLKKNELYNDSLIILTADHGEYMGEQNGKMLYFIHGFTVFEQEIRVPLILKLPGNKFKNKRIDSHVSVIDIFPTIMSIIGEEDINSEGKNLFTVIKSGRTENVNFIQVKNGEKIAIRKDDYKLVIESKYNVLQLIKELKKNNKVIVKKSLYNYKKYPNERKDIYKENTELGDKLAVELFDWLVESDQKTQKKYTSTPVLDEHTKRQLESLGYINVGK